MHDTHAFVPGPAVTRSVRGSVLQASRASSPPRRATVRCGSLEDSKKRARSPYDNIPDINQLYLRELARVEDKHGAGRGAPPAAPVPSILRPDGVRAPSADGARTPEVDEARRQAGMAAYAALRARLLADTAFVGGLGACAAWAATDTPRAAQSVAVGVAGALAYVVLLMRGVDKVSGQGDGLAPARVGLLGVLVIGAARRKEILDVVPLILGFFSYKIATVIPLLTGEAFDDSSATM